MRKAGTSSFLRYGMRACETGDMEACEYVGAYKHLVALADGEQSQGNDLLQTACAGDRWYACSVSNEPAKAVKLAMAACETSKSLIACRSAAYWLQSAKLQSEAAAMAEIGCREWMRQAGESYDAAKYSEEELATPSSCALAVELGIDVASLGPTALDYKGASRVAGHEQVHPPLEVAKRVARSRKTIVASYGLCHSAQGDITNIMPLRPTGYPSYDLKLFKAMQTWKYEPARRNGVPEASCETVSFAYRPR